MNTLAFGADHAGYDYKQALTELARKLGFEVLDLGTHSLESTDYPDHVHPAMEQILQGKAKFGVLICGSANGVAMTANKHKGIRAAICWNLEISKLARQHNNANVICIPARFVDLDMARKMLELFLNTPFEGGRHATRVQKIDC